jgi:hypothetical protein
MQAASDEETPLEEREHLPLPRSRLYFSMPSSARLVVPFAYGTLRHYEEQAMLKGRDVLARSLLEAIPGCAAAWAGDASCAHVLVIFPGAGAWFGVVESTLALAGDEEAGTYLRYIRWARAGPGSGGAQPVPPQVRRQGASVRESRSAANCAALAW